MKKSRTIVAVLISVLLLIGFGVVSPVMGAGTSGLTGLDRYVAITIGESGYYNTSMNITFPEYIPVNYTATGTITHDLDGSNTNKTNNWINITLSDGTNTTTFSSGLVALDANETVTFTVDTNFPVTDNATVTIKLENNKSQSDSWSGNVDIESNIAWTLSRQLTALLFSIIPLMILIVVILPIIVGLVKSIGEEAE